jgi:hypothetical protein
MKIIPGSIVTITNLSKASWYLYKKYLNFSPLLRCPCNYKRNTIMIVEDVFPNNVVLLKIKGENNLTMTFLQDLRLVHE